MCLSMETIKDIVFSLAAIATAGAAIWGINTWRRKIVGEKEFDSRVKILRSIQEVRKQIKVCRSPFFTSEELQYKDILEVVEEWGKKEKQAAAHFKRLERLRVKAIDLESAEMELKAILGQREFEEVSQLRQKVFDLIVETQLHYDLGRDDPAWKKNYETVFWQGSKDAFDAEIEGIIKKIFEEFKYTR